MTVSVDAMAVSTELSALIERYDVFFADQFGTLHDGASPYAGAVNALLAMRAAGKTIVILSNSGRSGADNAMRFLGLGFPSNSFDHFVTSGDVAVNALKSGALRIPISPETRCLIISSGKDTNFAKRLGLRVVKDARDADLVVISGSQADRIGLTAYEEILRPAAQTGVPAICTNPDIEMLAPTGLAPAAGAVAKLYESMGGRVRWIGKPQTLMYEYAHHLCGYPAKHRIVGIGDSVEHDIAGAAGFGIDAVLVRKGVSEGASRDMLLARATAVHPDIAGFFESLA